MIHWVDLILHDTSNVAEAHQELFRNTRTQKSQQNRKVRRTRNRKSQRNRKLRRTKNNTYEKYA